MTVDPRKYHPALAERERRKNAIEAGETPIEDAASRTFALAAANPGGYVDPDQAGVADIPRAGNTTQQPVEMETAPAAFPVIDDGLPDAVYVPPTEEEITAAPQPAPAAPSTPPGHNPPPAIDTELHKKLQEAQAERDALREQLAERDRAMREAALKQEVVFAEDELSISDPNDAATIARKAVLAAEARAAAAVADAEKRLRENMERELAVRQAAVAAEMGKRAELSHIRNVNQVLKTAVPEIEKIISTPTYKAYVNRPVEGGGTRLAQMQSAYARGDTEYIIQVLNKVKSAIPDIADVQRVAPSGVGQQYAPPQADVKVDEKELQKNLASAITGGRDGIEAFRAYQAERVKRASEKHPQA